VYVALCAGIPEPDPRLPTPHHPLPCAAALCCCPVVVCTSPFARPQTGDIEVRNLTAPEMPQLAIARGQGAHSAIVTSLVPVPGGPFFFSAAMDGSIMAWKLTL
jgi:hypothetical protein